MPPLNAKPNIQISIFMFITVYDRNATIITTLKHMEDIMSFHLLCCFVEQVIGPIVSYYGIQRVRFFAVDLLGRAAIIYG